MTLKGVFHLIGSTFSCLDFAEKVFKLVDIILTTLLI